MKAFVMQGLDRVGFADKPVPEPGPNDAIIRTTRALICTSDAHTVHGAIGPAITSPSATRRWASSIRLAARSGVSSRATGWWSAR